MTSLRSKTATATRNDSGSTKTQNLISENVLHDILIELRLIRTQLASMSG